jgi:ketosteroid isomerase-like protein
MVLLSLTMTSAADASFAIQQLIGRFAAATDVGTLEEYADCLTADAVMVIGDAATRTGRSEIVAAMTGSRDAGLFGPGSGTMHFTGASVVVVDGDEASVSTPFLFVNGASGKPEPVAMGRYTDTCRRTGDGWLIDRRHVQMG